MRIWLWVHLQRLGSCPQRRSVGVDDTHQIIRRLLKLTAAEECTHIFIENWEVIMKVLEVQLHNLALEGPHKLLQDVELRSPAPTPRRKPRPKPWNRKIHNRVLYIVVESLVR